MGRASCDVVWPQALIEAYGSAKSLRARRTRRCEAAAPEFHAVCPPRLEIFVTTSHPRVFIRFRRLRARLRERLAIGGFSGVNGNADFAAVRGTTTVHAVNGLATFPNLSIDRAYYAYQVVANTGTLIGVISAKFAVTAPVTPFPALAGQIAFLNGPGGAADSLQQVYGANPDGSG